MKLRMLEMSADAKITIGGILALIVVSVVISVIALMNTIVA